MSTAHAHDHGHSPDHGGHHGPANFWQKYVFSIDHKVIALQFTVVSLMFSLVGGGLALAVRYQLAWPFQNVPYARILPGQMTQAAPEANPALWPVGGEVTLKQVSDAAGNKLPDKTAARITAILQLGVTIPTGTEVRIGDGQPAVLEHAVNGTVQRSTVLGDYDYTALKPQVRARVGTEVLSDGQAYTITGIELHEPDGPGKSKTELVTDQNILMPVVAADTRIQVSVPAQTVQNDTLTSTVSPMTLEVPATAVTYTKQTLSTDAYIQLFTMHATVMIFFVLMPMLLGGFGNYLIPLMIGAHDMAFPRLNALSFWLSVPAGIMILVSFWTPGGAAGAGWTMYAPLSEAEFFPQLGTTLWVAAIGLVGFSTIVGTLNYITTVINMRAPGMTMSRMPLTVWSLFITAILALLATPVLTAAAILLMLDRTMGTTFFTPAGGGQPLMWQHLFWFFGHPEVYILILPAMGLTSDVLSTHARKPIFGYKPMVFAMAAIGFLGFIVWGHHMFQSGMNPTLGTTFMASTIMIAVPSAIKTFNWLGTLWGGNIRFTTPMLFALGFISMFVIGGLSGIFMASAPVDVHIHDTYFIVAHIHYVFFGGTVFGVFAGVYHWFPKIFGRQMNERWGKIHFWLSIIAFNGTFFIMHILGVGGHPRRYASIMEYPTLQHLQPLNVFMTISALMLGMAQIPFYYNFIVSVPRSLGRAMISIFAVGLVGSGLIGATAWNLFAGSPHRSAHILYHLIGQTDAGFSNTQTEIGYIILGATAIILAVLIFRAYTIGPRFAVVLATAGLLAIVIAVKCAAPAAIKAIADGTAGPMAPAISAMNLFFVSVGLAAPLSLLMVIGVFIIWAVGGALHLPWLLQRLLYIIMLPAYLSPLILKPDAYFWLGVPTLHDHSCLLLGLAALPGLIYLVVCRPRDEFGAPAGANPWQANSLEWCTTSPPPFTNFDTIPVVHRGPYEYSSPVVHEDYLPQPTVLPPGVVEPVGR